MTCKELEYPLRGIRCKREFELNMLRTGQKLSQKDPALCARIEQPSMAQLLSRLERDGMIKRSPDPDDGRSSLNP